MTLLLVASCKTPNNQSKIQDTDSLAESTFKVDVISNDVLVTHIKKNIRYTTLNPNSDNRVNSSTALDICANLKYANIDTWALTSTDDVNVLADHNAVFLLHPEESKKIYPFESILLTIGNFNGEGRTFKWGYFPTVMINKSYLSSRTNSVSKYVRGVKVKVSDSSFETTEKAIQFAKEKLAERPIGSDVLGEFNLADYRDSGVDEANFICVSRVE